MWLGRRLQCPQQCGVMLFDDRACGEGSQAPEKGRSGRGRAGVRGDLRQHGPQQGRRVLGGALADAAGSGHGPAVHPRQGHQGLRDGGQCHARRHPERDGQPSHVPPVQDRRARAATGGLPPAASRPTSRSTSTATATCRSGASPTASCAARTRSSPTTSGRRAARTAGEAADGPSPLGRPREELGAEEARCRHRMGS